MNLAAILYFISAGVFAFVGVVFIDAFAKRYPDHEPYDDEVQ